MNISKEQRAFETAAIAANAKWVEKIARKYLGRGYPLEDLMQEGYIGLVKACRKWQSDGGAKLSTFAMLHIQSSIRTMIGERSDGKLVDPPLDEQIDAPSFDEVLEGCIGPQNPEQLAIEAERSRALVGAIACLPTHQREIMVLALDADELTNEEIGFAVKRSRARVHQLRTIAVGALRASIGGAA